MRLKYAPGFVSAENIFVNIGYYYTILSRARVRVLALKL